MDTARAGLGPGNVTGFGSEWRTYTPTRAASRPESTAAANTA
jgi:hypothetical protein